MTEADSSMVNIVNPFQILTQSQRRQAIIMVLLTLLQALLDIFSLAAIIPVFYALFSSNRELIFLDVSAETLNANWQFILLAIIALFAIKNFLTLRLARRQSDFISNIAVSLTEKLYRQFYRQSWQDYLRDNSAEVVRKIKNTPSDFAQYILQGYITLVCDSVSCLLMLGLMVFYDYRVVVIIAAVVTPVAILYFLYRRKIILGIDRSFRELTPLSNVILTQGVDSFAEARIYRKEEFFIQRFMAIRKTTSQHLADLNAATSIPSRLFELTGIICFATIVFYAKTFGDPANMVIVLGLLTVAMYRIIPSLNRILLTISQIEAYAYATAELKKGFPSAAFDTQTEGKESVGFHDRIQLRDLLFHYHKDKNIFEGLSLTIQKGDFVMIEGPSGVGKSTLLHILAGLLDHYEGEIVVDGHILGAAGFRKFQNSMGFVSQSPTLFQDTLLRNITLSEDNDIDKEKLKAACEVAGLSSFVKDLPEGYGTTIGERGTNVSGGQRQRINLARALYRDTDILLLDEVTNQLDHQTKELVLDNLRALCAKGKTIVLSSHDHLVKSYATKIVKLG